MRNTEQLMKSVGLLAYEFGSLQECNEELSKYGPENFKADRITVKLRPGQQTAPNRNNISFSSCSGDLSKAHVKEVRLLCDQCQCHFLVCCCCFPKQILLYRVRFFFVVFLQ